ncbi:TPA: lipooligosaccharide biosynthesis family 4 glycosyltransferase LsgC, partial [Haemophilus influenzae]
ITKKLRELVKELQLDTLIVVDGAIMLFSALALVNLNIKHILWEHYSFNFTGNRLVRTLGKYLAVTTCDKIVTLTEAEKTLWQEKFKTNNIITIANPNTLLPKNKLAKWENKTILSVGHLFSYKGFDYLLKVWQVLAKKYPDWNLKIVGSGEEEENLKNLAKALDIEDSVNFTPRTNDVSFYYESSSIYCLPSQTEGLPLVVIEAMAFGLPIVAFNCSPGVKQLVEHKENGFLCEKNNIEEMVKGLDLLINNPELY